MIDDAIKQTERFRGISLAQTIADIEARLAGTVKNEVTAVNNSLHLDKALITSAAQVKRASAQIDVIIHAAGILYTLPRILEDGEIVESLSLGAGNAGSDFDLVTDRRIAEFKFIHWQGGSEAVRKKTFFEDYFKLIRTQSRKIKYFYLLNTEIPLRFLKGKSKILRMLDRNRRLANDFQRLYGDKFQTVGEYYSMHQGQVQFINLLDIAPDLKELVGLTVEEDRPSFPG